MDAYRKIGSFLPAVRWVQAPRPNDGKNEIREWEFGFYLVDALLNPLKFQKKVIDGTPTSFTVYEFRLLGAFALYKAVRRK